MGKGMIRVWVGAEPIDSAKWIAYLDDPAFGAQVIFLGVVRETNLGKKVLNVAYDAFGPLAECVLRTIASEAQARFGIEVSVAVAHRTGLLAVGEASVLVAVSTPHREAAYDASRYVIEELKVRVPIWKKEIYADGETEWLRGHALCDHSHGDPGRGALHAHGEG